ncbi:MAG: hypothetical protein PHV13_00960 [Candidatus ainarchaeum sp.]|nr:hypothetical protein [Candidatus ainarchaeum sp.]
MDKLYEDSETGCCQRFEPGPWDGKEIVWKDKLFVRDRVLSLFHIPLNFGQVIVRNMEKIKAANALPEKALMLSDENSMFGSDVYINVSRNVPGARMEKVSGRFLTRVFEGPYQDMGKWVQAMHDHVKAKNRKMKKMYFFYTTCPSCAKYYGKNYVVILAQV